MLSVPRPIGLPTSARPQGSSKPETASSYSVPSGLPLASPVRSLPQYLVPGAPSPHSRSRSQPPRAISLSRHGRSASTTPRTYDDNDTYRQPKARSPSRVVSRERPSTQTSRSRQPSASPKPQDTSPATSYARPPNRKATIDESSGDGYAIWNVVSSVASALTISVSKAWSTNIPAFTGEETPPGQDSRLTRAMKAYHIAKARDPSDLPAWLFDERERRAGDTTAQSDELTDRGVQDPPPQHRISSTSRHGERWALTSASPPSIPFQPRLRGTDRLKAMREAKREIGEHDSSGDFGNDSRHPYISTNTPTQPQPTTRHPRIGLPSGPQRGRRR